MLQQLIKTLFIVALFGAFKVGGQCIIGESYSRNGNFPLSLTSKPCKAFKLGPMVKNSPFELVFSENKIDCNVANIIIQTEDQFPIYDFCANNLYSISDRQIIKLKYDGRYLIVNLLLQTYSSLTSMVSLTLSDSSAAIPFPSKPITSTQFPGSGSTSNSFSNYATCGRPSMTPSISQELRIVGGSEANPNSWPWQAFITDNRLMCGGSLINNEWVLTAAHCIESASIDVYLGQHDLRYRRVPIKSKKIIVHENYEHSSTRIRNDIALIKLDSKVIFTETVKPVCLPNSFNAIPGRVGAVTGWGQIEGGEGGRTAIKLLQTTLPIIANSECGNFDIDDSQICAGYFQDSIEKGSCQGDSGGPYVTKEGDNYVLAGVVSFGRPYCDGYSVYTNVYAFMDWIKNTINSN